jgi:hypothetical protein
MTDPFIIDVAAIAPFDELKAEHEVPLAADIGAAKLRLIDPVPKLVIVTTASRNILFWQTV